MRRTHRGLLLGLVAALAAGAAFAQTDFSNYVALGDSYGAGFTNLSLLQKHQMNSYPAILARQVGFSGTFQQPLITDPGIPAELELSSLSIVNGQVVPEIVPKSSSTGLPINIGYQGIYNNLSIPGAATNDLLTLIGTATNLPQDAVKYAQGQIGAAQLFADIVLRDGQHTALQQAIGAQGTFYTVWIGGDDVSGAVLSAVVVDGITMTTTTDFQTQYATLIGAIRQQRPNATIVVANLADELLWPFASTIKPYLVNPSNGSHIPLIGENGPLTEQDFVTLNASALLAQGIGIPQAAGGTGLPLPEGSIDQTGLHAGVIIRADEAAAIRARTAALNQIIAAVATQFNAKLVDVGPLWAQLTGGTYVLGGVPVTSAFLTGGVFGYDGFHPTELGYAIVANEFVKQMNAQLGTKVPQVNLLPFLYGGGTAGATSVAAANTVFSTQAAVALVKSRLPNALTDKLEPGRPVHRRVTALATAGVSSNDKP